MADIYAIKSEFSGLHEMLGVSPDTMFRQEGRLLLPILNDVADIDLSTIHIHKRASIIKALKDTRLQNGYQRHKLNLENESYRLSLNQNISEMLADNCYAFPEVFDSLNRHTNKRNKVVGLGIAKSGILYIINTAPYRPFIVEHPIIGLNPSSYTFNPHI